MITHILDTSAIMVHFLNGPGAETVNEILHQGADKAGFCVVCYPELKRRLRKLLPDEGAAKEVFHTYTHTLMGSVNVTRKAGDMAAELIQGWGEGVPVISVIVAACAIAEGAVLVHSGARVSESGWPGLREIRLSAK
jgi:predicted nucleic acid-binding protein